MQRVSWKSWLQGRKGDRSEGARVSARWTAADLAKPVPSFSGERVFLLQLSQCSSVSSSVTLENSLHLSELSTPIGLTIIIPYRALIGNE